MPDTAIAPNLLDEARLRTLFDNLPEALAVLDTEGRILDINPAGSALFGHSREALLGMNARALSTDAARLDEERIGEIIGSRGWFTTPFTGLRADGTTFPLETTLTFGTIGGRDVIFCLVRDMSAPYRLNADIVRLSGLARLHEAGRDLRQVAREAVGISRRALGADQGAVGRVRRDGHLDWLAQHGMEAMESAINHRRDLEAIPAVAGALADGRPVFVDRRLPEFRPGPHREFMESLGTVAYAFIPVKAGDDLTGALTLLWSHEPPELVRNKMVLETVGRLVGMALANTMLRDTLLARSKALDESEARYRTLFYEAPEALLFETPDGHVVDANRAAERLYGHPRDQLLGMSVDQLTLMTAEQRQRRAEVVAANGRGVFRGVGMRADGSTYPEELEVALTQLAGQDHYLVQVRDLSEEQRLQAELLQAQKMEALGHLVSGVAHELNNPLSAIVAFSQLIRRNQGLAEDLRHDADMLVQEADRTRRIVQNLLDFARQRPPERRATDVHDLVERTLQLHSFALGANRIAVELDVPTSLPPIDVDPNQAQQVLLNLTLNAIQALAERGGPGRLFVTATRVPASEPGHELVRITVGDDGLGVPEAQRADIFTPFFTTKPVGQGTGLGLPVSFGIVAAHGGRLWFEPRAGGGSDFHVELPAAVRRASDPGAGRGRRRRSRPTAGGTVLVIDDEPAIRAFLARTLLEAGHGVIAAASGAEALEQIRGRRVDAVLLDHRLVGMDGLEAFERLRRLRPRLARRTILMSGDVFDGALRSFAEANGLHLLAKPFDLDTVETTIRQALDGRPAGLGAQSPRG
ncbi:MAG TPA: PAS domain S-box protein [Candidatus Limnocylindrales bacterium]|nr:PAS domain S-box protein [Candidatus Limnocylindrales bacterium]